MGLANALGNWKIGDRNDFWQLEITSFLWEKSLDMSRPAEACNGPCAFACRDDPWRQNLAQTTQRRPFLFSFGHRCEACGMPMTRKSEAIWNAKTLNISFDTFTRSQTSRKGLKNVTGVARMPFCIFIVCFALTFPLSAFLLPSRCSFVVSHCGCRSLVALEISQPKPSSAAQKRSMSMRRLASCARRRGNAPIICPLVESSSAPSMSICLYLSVYHWLSIYLPLSTCINSMGTYDITFCYSYYVHLLRWQLHS